MQVVADALPPTINNMSSEQRPHFQNLRINISALLFERTLLWNVDGRTRDTTDKNFNKMEPAQSNRKRFRMNTCVLQIPRPWAKICQKVALSLCYLITCRSPGLFPWRPTFPQRWAASAALWAGRPTPWPNGKAPQPQAEITRANCFECRWTHLVHSTRKSSSVSWFILKPLWWNSNINLE